jgi:hypothetical protein
VFSLSGVSHVPTGTNAAAITNTLANGTYVGQRKKFVVDGAQTTSSVVITVTAGLKQDGSTALSTFTLTSAAQYADLEWSGDKWYVRSHTYASDT